jgi:hypothetical protein
LAANISGARGLRRHDAGSQARDHRVIAAVDRQGLEALGLERFADRPRPRLQQRRGAGNEHLFADTTGLENEIRPNLFLNADGDAAPRFFLEPLKLDVDPICAGADRREDVGAVLARHAGQGQPLTFMRDGDGGARYDRP